MLKYREHQVADLAMDFLQEPVLVLQRLNELMLRRSRRGPGGSCPIPRPRRVVRPG